MEKSHRVEAAMTRLLREQMERPLGGGLHLVATPIGNLGDLTLRAAATIANADQVYCEDTRHSRKLLEACGVSRQLFVYEEHSAPRVRPAILAKLEAGHSVALISDAGMPLVSDPGHKLVREVIAAGHSVFVIPGASASLSALALSGLATDRFLFLGFLPTKSAARRQRLAELAERRETLVLFEAPNRLRALLEDCADVLGVRPAAVARELTKRHEEVLRGTLAELALWAGEHKPRGEVAVVIGVGEAGEISDREILEWLASCAPELSLRDRVKQTAEELKVPKKRVYALGLAEQKALNAAGNGSASEDRAGK